MVAALAGFLVLESAVALSDEVSFFHVIRPEETCMVVGRPGSSPPAALDLFPRACFFQPLAGCYLGRERYKSIEMARLGIVARAEATRPFDHSKYAELSESELFRNQDFKGLKAASLMTGRVAAPVQFSTNLHPVDWAIPVATFRTIPPLSYAQVDLRLLLDQTHRPARKV
jgi:hypothetical protein